MLNGDLRLYQWPGSTQTDLVADIIRISDANARKKAQQQRALKAKAKGRTLCGHGFHQWVVATRNRFDVKRGRLVTEHRCQRCGASKTSLT
jgi:hypothetical protein